MFAKGGEVYFMARLYFSSLVQILRLFLFSINANIWHDDTKSKGNPFLPFFSTLFLNFKIIQKMQVYICE